MVINNLKIYLTILAGLLVGSLAHAAELTPPKLPVLFYGAVSIDGAPVNGGQIISARLKSDGAEIASAAASAAGKYFIEIPCADYAGQTVVFNINGLIAAETACPDAMAVPSVNLNLSVAGAAQTAPASPDQGSAFIKSNPPAILLSPQTARPAAKTSPLTPAIPSIPPAAQVLGVKYYADGQLIRGRDHKIYLIKNGGLKVIRNYTQLLPYREQTIHDVADEVIRQYLEFDYGSLIRGPDNKIYLAGNGQKRLIKNLNELRQYADRTIHNVSAEILGKYRIVEQIKGVKYYADGQLIRGRDHKIYLIENGGLKVIRNYTQLLPYREQTIHDVADEEIRQYLPFFNGQLIRGPDDKIFLIKLNKKQPILSLAELKKYHNQKIHNVSQKILENY